MSTTSSGSDPSPSPRPADTPQPCPYPGCGWSEPRVYRGVRSHVWCPGCEASGPEKIDTAAAILAWNLVAGQAGELERLRGHNKRMADKLRDVAEHFSNEADYGDHDCGNHDGGSPETCPACLNRRTAADLLAAIEKGTSL